MDIIVETLPLFIMYNGLLWKLDPTPYGNQFDYVPVKVAQDRTYWHSTFRLTVTDGNYGPQLSTDAIIRKALMHIEQASRQFEAARKFGI